MPSDVQDDIVDEPLEHENNLPGVEYFPEYLPIHNYVQEYQWASFSVVI